MSAEPTRKCPYSSDIRWRIVYHRLARNLPFSKIAQNLSIAPSTAWTTFKLFMRTGCVDSTERSSRPELRALDESAELNMIGFILENPSMYLDEVCSKLLEIIGIQVSPSTICRV